MKFGFGLPNHWGVEDPKALIRMAVQAEELGYKSLWVADHVFNVSYVRERLDNRPYYDPMSTLAYVAAVTDSIELATSVLVLPYHNAIRLAKVSATIDQMSGGRLKLGVGVGVIPEELDAMGASMAKRGEISDESIEVMKTLWTEEEPSFQGKHYSFSGMKFSPKPVQKPYVPLLIGGTSKAALRRAARVGDGWHAANMTPQEMSSSLDYLKEQASAQGRSYDDLDISIRLSAGVVRDPSTMGNPSGYSLGDTPEDIVLNVKEFQELGVSQICISINTLDSGQITRVMEMAAKDVFPAFE